MSINPSISWQHLLERPVSLWFDHLPDRIQINLLLDTLKENWKPIKWNPMMQQKAVQFLNACNLSIYSGLIAKIQNVIETCGLAPLIFENVKANALSYTIDFEPDLLFLLSLRGEPSMLKSYRAIVTGDLNYLQSNPSPPLTCYTPHQFTPIHAAALFNRNAILETLIEQAANPGEAINKKTAKGWTPLMLAATNGCSEAVKVLLDKGAKTEETVQLGYTVLMMAVGADQPEVIRLLLAGGANLEARTSQGFSALMIEAEAGRQNSVQFILDNGANIEAASKTGRTALIIATAKGNLETVRLLANRGANLEAKTVSGFSPLLYAAQEGRNEILELLLDKGAIIDGAAKQGQTALMIAAANGHLETVRLLINRGAHLEAQAENGFTAMTFAIQEGRQNIEELLLNSGAKWKLARSFNPLRSPLSSSSSLSPASALSSSSAVKRPLESKESPAKRSLLQAEKSETASPPAKPAAANKRAADSDDSARKRV